MSRKIGSPSSSFLMTTLPLLKKYNTSRETSASSPSSWSQIPGNSCNKIQIQSTSFPQIFLPTHLSAQVVYGVTADGGVGRRVPDGPRGGTPRGWRRRGCGAERGFVNLQKYLHFIKLLGILVGPCTLKSIADSFWRWVVRLHYILNYLIWSERKLPA